MQKSRLITPILSITAVVGAFVGIALVFAPVWFQGTSEIATTDNPSAPSKFRRRPLVTLTRWLVGLGAVGLGYGTIVVVWRAMGSRDYDNDNDFLWSVTVDFSALAGLYVLLIVWWVDHLLAKRGRRRALVGHCVIAAVMGIPLLTLGSRGEGVVVYVLVLATTVGAVLLAGLIPGSFARETAASRASGETTSGKSR